jgi:hypothetical protein
VDSFALGAPSPLALYNRGLFTLGLFGLVMRTIVFAFHLFPAPVSIQPALGIFEAKTFGCGSDSHGIAEVHLDSAVALKPHNASVCEDFWPKRSSIIYALFFPPIFLSIC